MRQKKNGQHSACFGQVNQTNYHESQYLGWTQALDLPYSTLKYGRVLGLANHTPLVPTPKFYPAGCGLLAGAGVVVRRPGAGETRRATS